MNSNLANASIPEQSISVIATYFGVMEEEVLISAASSGDSGAFVELYLRHNKKVLPRIYRITRNREDAEDALQDAALKAFVHLRSFEGRSSFASWFTRIAINSALMVLRKKRTRSKVSIEQLSGQSENHLAWEPQDHAESPEDCYARRESEELLRKTIQHLPCIFREAVELQQSEECSIGQVSAELGISKPAAKSRLMRARKVLRHRLSGERRRTVSTLVLDRQDSPSRTNSKAVSASATGRLEAVQSEGGREQ
jgi:RNA polymerase sigma-70 factor (ECF subfamily)